MKLMSLASLGTRNKALPPAKALSRVWEYDDSARHIVKESLPYDRLFVQLSYL
jgi:hypothetical protein